MSGSLQARLDIRKSSKKRLRGIKFGVPVTNICAGELGRHMWFVRMKIIQRQRHAECTDKKGRFGCYGLVVIYPGHLEADECTKLFSPVWESYHGPKS